MDILRKKGGTERKDVITENLWCCDFTGDRPPRSDSIEHPLVVILVKTGYFRMFTHFSIRKRISKDEMAFIDFSFPFINLHTNVVHLNLVPL